MAVDWDSMATALFPHFVEAVNLDLDLVVHLAVVVEAATLK